MTTLHDISIKSIDGAELPLASFRGKVVLVVNVASRCGYTPQYAGLENLHEQLAEKGLVVLGVPSNDFGAQEPAAEPDIKAFCETRFGVKFAMTEKVAVLGAQKHPLYAFLTSEAQPAGDVQWNFEKFLVGKDGQVRERFPSSIEPDARELRAAIDALL